MGKPLVLTLTTLFALPVATAASVAVETAAATDAAAAVVAADGPSELLSREVILYQGGFAAVAERRRLPTAGPHRLGGLPDTLRPETLDVEGESGVAVSDVRWIAAGASRGELLRAFVGREVVLAPRAEVAASQRTGLLLAMDGDIPVVHVDGRVEFGGDSAPWRVVLPMPQPPVTGRPLGLSSSAEGPIRIRYLADGLGWSADHTLTLAGEQGRLETTATLRNESDVALNESRIRLVSGDVAAERGAAPEVAVMRSMAADSVDAETMSVGGWRLYALDGALDMTPGQHHRRVLATHAPIPVRREYRLEGRGDRTWGDAASAAPMPAAVSLALRVPADAETLPAGNLRVFDRDSEGRPNFLGAANIQAQAPDSRFTVRLGQALGVQGVRHRTALRRLDRQRYEIAWRLEVHNGSDQKARVNLVERLQGDWSLIEGEDWVREDSETLTRSLELGAGERVTVSYSVRLTR